MRLRPGQIIVVVFGVAVAGVLGWLTWQQQELRKSLTSQASRETLLQRQVVTLRNQLADAGHEQEELASRLSENEMRQREVVRQKSQDELLTAAVEANTPAVVSIVVSKDIQQLEVVYVNPFGDDPFFRNFNFRVPVYRQKESVHQKVGAGTGFVVTPTGHIVTNRHVVDDATASYTVLLANGDQKPAQVVYRDDQHDVAVIKIDGAGLPTVSLGDSAAAKLGQTVVAIGNALGEYENSVSVGIISGLNRTVEATSQGGVERLTGVIQTDAAINPGNSGGPLIDLDGRVVGINVATVLGSQSIGFALPINDLKPLLAEHATP